MAQDVLITPASTKIAFTDSGDTTTVLKTSSGRFEFKDSGESNFVDIYANDIVLDGNLTVGGTTTTVNTSNILIEDPILQLAKGQTSGSPSVDIGFVGLRGDSNNAAFIWDESDDVFAAILTTGDGSATTLTPASYAGFKAAAATFSGALKISYANPAFDLQQSGTSRFRAELDGGNITYLSTIGSYSMVLRTNQQSALTLDNAQNATFHGTIALQNGSVSAPALRFATDTNTGIYHSNDNNIRMAINGVKAFELDASRNLHISGGGTFTGSVGIVSGSGSGTLTGRLHIGSTTSTDNNSLVFWRGAKPSLNANQGAILYENGGMSDGEGMTFMSDKGYKFLDDAGTTEWARITSSGSVGIGTNAPSRPLEVIGTGSASVIRVGDGDTDGAAAIAYIEFGANGSSWNRHSYMGSAGADSHLWIVNEENADIKFYANNAEKMVIKNDGKVGIGSTSPVAPLDVPRASNYKVIKLGDDITSHYVMTGNSDHTLTLTCGSYYQAEIIVTAHQTNGGTYNNLYIRGIWSNNDTSHHWDEIENVGSLTNSTFTITNGQNGATANSGEWKIVHDYVSGTFVKFTVRITDFYGTHAYTIS